MSNQLSPFTDLDALVIHLRELNKKNVLIYAHNGIGKTRLSMTFKDAGKADGNADTLYFNAFTEDLFHWNNDLSNDKERELILNQDSRFFDGLWQLEMDNRIRPLLRRYADFDFTIKTDDWKVVFSRQVNKDGKTQTIDNIKISRGEENIFVWCFFLAIAELAIDGQLLYLLFVLYF